MFLKSISKISIILFVLGFLLIPSAQAQSVKQVVLVLADYLTLVDLQSPEASFFQELSNSAAIGLMNTNTASSRTSPHTHATISAGRPVQGGSSSILASNTQDSIQDELACALFERYTGRPSGDKEIVIINWPQIIRSNKLQGKHDYLPGTLGTILKEAGISIAVFGNSDTTKSIHRPAALIATDSQGIVPSGEVGESILKPSQGLLPWRTDYNKLLAEVMKAIPTTDFLVIDLGDLNRLEELQHFGLDQVVQRERNTIIGDIDSFSRTLMAELDMKNTLLIFASTTPSNSQAQAKNFLVPIMMIGNDLGPGLLTSNTTRRVGLIANTDITASILSFFDVPSPPQMTGQPATNIRLTKAGSWSYLQSLNEQMVFTYQIRPLIIKPYVALQIVSIIFSVPLFFTLRRVIPYYRYWLGILVAFPMALLLVGTFTYRSLSAYVITSIVLTLLVVSLSFHYSSDSAISPFICLSTLTASLILFDVMTGSSFMQQSVLGFDPIAGARYYGIGNEYMGVLIGSSFLGIGIILRQKSGRLQVLIVAMYFCLLIWLMMAANYGANFGGTVAALSAFAYWFWRWQKGFFKRYLVYLLPLTIAFLILLFIGGLGYTTTSQSHIGRAFTLVRQEGLGELLDIAVRKGQMNIKLIRYTPWSRVFLLALLTIGILFSKPTGFIQRLYSGNQPLYEAFLAILVGSFAALIWNDSGIVAAATTMIYGVYPLLSIALKEHYIKARETGSFE